MLEDPPHTGHPVGPLSVNQMADDIEGAPRLTAFMGQEPAVGQVTQKGIDDCRRAREDCPRFIHHESTARAIDLVGHAITVLRSSAPVTG